jgi:hypothetical protein
VVASGLDGVGEEEGTTKARRARRFLEGKKREPRRHEGRKGFWRGRRGNHKGAKGAKVFKGEKLNTEVSRIPVHLES